MALIFFALPGAFLADFAANTTCCWPVMRFCQRGEKNTGVENLIVVVLPDQQRFVFFSFICFSVTKKNVKGFLSFSFLYFLCRRLYINKWPRAKS